MERTGADLNICRARDLGVGSGRDERQMGRKAARRKSGVPVSVPELLGRFTVGGHEPAISFPELLADFPRRGVDEGRR